MLLAILLHKPLNALSIAGSMQAAGFGRRALVLANMGFALLCPLAALVVFGGVGIGPG